MNMNPFATTTTITESENEKMGSFGATDMGAENVAVEKGVSKPKSMEFHRQQLKEKLDGDKYVSLFSTRFYHWIHTQAISLVSVYC